MAELEGIDEKTLREAAQFHGLDMPGSQPPVGIEDIDDATLQAAADFHGEGAEPPAEAPGAGMIESVGGALEQGARQIAQGALLGWYDEFAAGVRSMMTGRPYEELLAEEREILKRFEEEHPGWSIALQTAGSVVSPASKVLAPIKGATVAGRAASGAFGGGKIGAVYGAGSAEGGVQERLEGAGVGAVTGAVTGGLVTPAAEKLATKASTVMAYRAARKALRETAPSTKELAKKSKRSFEAAEEGGALLKKDSYNNLLYDMADMVEREGVAEGLHAKVFGVMSAISKRGNKNQSMRDLQIARRQIGIAARSSEPDEARIGNRMLDEFDNYVDGLSDKDVIAGTVEGAGKSLKKARSLWSRIRKTETIETIIEDADLQASGFENGIRIGFRQLLKNKKRLRGFTKDEKTAMRKIVEGTVAANALKRIGKLSPGRGQQTNALMSLLGAGGAGGAGLAMAGPVGAGVAFVAIPTAGYAAQKGAERLTKRGADYLRDLAASGGKAAKSPDVLSPSQRLSKSALRGGVPLVSEQQ